MTQPLSGSCRQNNEPSHRYLALHLPWLSADRVRLAEEAARGGRPPENLGSESPLVLTEKQRGAMRLAALSPQAAALGLEVGLSLADARARVPGLRAVPQDAAADARLLARLTKYSVRYSPHVAPDPPCGVLLDSGGCAHLWGGEAAMQAALARDIEAMGLHVRVASGVSPLAARALARHGGNAVEALPVAALDLEGGTHLALRRAGLLSVRDLLAVPRSALAARFGSALPQLLARLMGREDMPIDPVHLPAPLIAQMRFAEPLARTADVLDVAESLCSEVAVQMAERGAGGRAFRLRLHRSDGHIATLTLETGAPTRDPAWVMRLLRERIDSLADPLDPGFGYDSIDLQVTRTEPLADVQGALVEERARILPLDPLLDRLAVRHGWESLLQAATGDSHMPERAAGLVPLGRGRRGAGHMPEPGEPPLRPLTLFSPPERITVLAAVPDGPPRRFSWRGGTHKVTWQEGPERLAPEWWRRPAGHEGDPGLSRDYYRVEDESGRRFWLFRHGLYDRETGDPQWYVHGLFA